MQDDLHILEYGDKSLFLVKWRAFNSLVSVAPTLKQTFLKFLRYKVLRLKAFLLLVLALI